MKVHKEKGIPRAFCAQEFEWRLYMRVQRTPSVKIEGTTSLTGKNVLTRNYNKIIEEQQKLMSCLSYVSLSIACDRKCVQQQKGFFQIFVKWYLQRFEKHKNVQKEQTSTQQSSLLPDLSFDSRLFQMSMTGHLRRQARCPQESQMLWEAPLEQNRTAGNGQIHSVTYCAFDLQHFLRKKNINRMKKRFNWT